MQGKATVQIIGNLTRDPEIKFTASNDAVTTFGIAVNKKWKDANGNAKEQVSYIDCEFWGKGGETMAKFVAKGSPLAIDGELIQQRWEHEGKNHSKVIIRVVNFTLIGSKGDGEQSSSRAAIEADLKGKAKARPSAPAPRQIVDEDIPF